MSKAKDIVVLVDASLITCIVQRGMAEDVIKAAQDAGAKRIMPVHWGGFCLAHHHWKEPVERFASEAKAKNVDFITPQIGELFTVNSVLENNWWQKLD